MTGKATETMETVAAMEDAAAVETETVETVTVGLDARSYDIVIGAGILSEAGQRTIPFLPRQFTVIVTDENVADQHLPALQAGLEAGGVRSEAIILPAGESAKSMANLALVVERLLDLKIEREDSILAFGGGVIGDLAGFAAAILRRGVDYIQIPTTLLAQADSSVGGKTGINAPQGKNLIGAFHQPRLVLTDISVLASQAERDFLSGYAEVMKYGLGLDAGFFEWLEENAAAMRERDPTVLAQAVSRACQIKAWVVARDERDRGDRALLNLGHTFGHALEAATGYSGRLLHGEGVSIGCGLAFDVSARMGLCAQEVPARVQAHMAEMGLMRRVRDISGDLPDAGGLIALMAQDKKVKLGRTGFILARGIGEAFATQEADITIVEAVLEEALTESVAGG